MSPNNPFSLQERAIGLLGGMQQASNAAVTPQVKPTQYIEQKSAAPDTPKLPDYLPVSWSSRGTEKWDPSNQTYAGGFGWYDPSTGSLYQDPRAQTAKLAPQWAPTPPDSFQPWQKVKNKLMTSPWFKMNFDRNMMEKLGIDESAIGAAGGKWPWMKGYM